MSVLQDIPDLFLFIGAAIALLLTFWLGRCSKGSKKEEPQYIYKPSPAYHRNGRQPAAQLEPPVTALIPTPRLNQQSNVNCCVFFFPDTNEPCETYYSSFSHATNANLSAIKRCRNPKCSRMHLHQKHQSSLIRILELFRPARTIDICMFRFTLDGLCKVLIYLKQRQVKIRIIADKSVEENENSCIETLREAGIEVREMYYNPNQAENKRPLMHNKFVVVDKRLCLLGSFNWTWMALMKHEESVIQTDHELIVKPLVQRFELLWARFSPAANMRALQSFNDRTSRPARQLKPPAKANKLVRGRSR